AHRFQAGFEQQFLREWIADLHSRTLLHRGLVEFRRRHRRAVNPVASGLRADVDHRITYALGLTVKDMFPANQSERESVDQRVERITIGESDLAADCGDSEAVAVIAEPFHHAGH